MKKTAIKDKIEGNELDLSMNGLVEVPVQELASAPKATHLDLSCNEIHSLPNAFTSLTHLVKIDLSKNFLTLLPQNFGNLTNLEYLDLYGNQLSFLPVSFCRLKRLRWLDLKNNPLSPQLKQIAGDCLDQKQCQSCAKAVVAYMQSMESTLEREKQRRLREEREIEAARVAREQKELAEQRRIKKAEREKRKAEKKEKLTSQQKRAKENDSNDDDQKSGVNDVKETGKSKSASWCKSCFLAVLMISTLLAVSLIGMHIIHQGHDLQSFTAAIQETCVEFRIAIQVWWNAFALPYLESTLADLQDFWKSIRYS